MADPYSELLIRAHKNPGFRAQPEEFVKHAEEINPTCGDHVHLYLQDDGSLRWEGKGCMICLASAEILCRYDADQIRKFMSILTESDEKTEVPDDIKALLITADQYPMRSKCVTLAWKAWQKLSA